MATLFSSICAHRTVQMECFDKFIVVITKIEEELIWWQGNGAFKYSFKQNLLAFRLLSDVSYSDECRTKTVLSVCEKNVSAFSCNSEAFK